MLELKVGVVQEERNRERKKQESWHFEDIYTPSSPYEQYGTSKDSGVHSVFSGRRLNAKANGVGGIF